MSHRGKRCSREWRDEIVVFEPSGEDEDVGVADDESINRRTVHIFIRVFACLGSASREVCCSEVHTLSRERQSVARSNCKSDPIVFGRSRFCP